MSTAPSATTAEAPQEPSPAPSPSRWTPLRPLVLRLHFYAGVLVAPFLLVAATTGFLYAGAFQAERIVYAHELTVPVGDRELPISQQVTAARTAHPEGTVSAVRPSPEAGATTRVMLSGVKGIAADHTLAVFVDPYTGKVRGALEQYGSTGALPLRTWIDELHRDLHLGETGRLYSEFAASWLWVIAGGGLVLWFSRRRALRKVRGTSGRLPHPRPARHGGSLDRRGLHLPVGDRTDLVDVRRRQHRPTPHLPGPVDPLGVGRGERRARGPRRLRRDRRRPTRRRTRQDPRRRTRRRARQPGRDRPARRRQVGVRRPAGPTQLARETGRRGRRPRHGQGHRRTPVRGLPVARQTDPLGYRPAYRRPLRPRQPDSPDAARRLH